MRRTAQYTELCQTILSLPGTAASDCRAVLNFFVIVPSNPSTPPTRRPLFVPGSAEARGSVKAARFRTAFVQLRASGVLRTACDSPAFPPRPSNGHRGRHWGGLISERTSYDERNQQDPPDASRLRGDQERRGQVLAADRSHVGSPRRQGLQSADRL